VLSLIACFAIDCILPIINFSQRSSIQFQPAHNLCYFNINSLSPTQPSPTQHNPSNMSRVSHPMAKFTHTARRISSSANAGRPSGLLDSQSRSSPHLPRKASDLKAECRKRQLKTASSKAEVRSRVLIELYSS
jgi:hypothetical protein